MRRGWRRGPPRHGRCEFQPPPGFRPAFSSRQKSHQECSTTLGNHDDHPHGKRSARQPVSPDRLDCRVASAHSYRRQEDKCGPARFRGLASNSRDFAPLVCARHARVDQAKHGGSVEQERQESCLVTWEVVFSRHALQDAKKLTSAGLRAKAEDLLAVIAADPFQNPRPYEKLVGNLSGAFSRRINIQHRLVLRGLRQGRNGTRAAHVDPLRVSARANRNAGLCSHNEELCVAGLPRQSKLEVGMRCWSAGTAAFSCCHMTPLLFCGNAHRRRLFSASVIRSRWCVCGQK